MSAGVPPAWAGSLRWVGASTSACDECTAAHGGQSASRSGAADVASHLLLCHTHSGAPAVAAATAAAAVFCGGCSRAEAKGIELTQQPPLRNSLQQISAHRQVARTEDRPPGAPCCVVAAQQQCVRARVCACACAQLCTICAHGWKLAGGASPCMHALGCNSNRTKPLRKASSTAGGTIWQQCCNRGRCILHPRVDLRDIIVCMSTDGSLVVQRCVAGALLRSSAAPLPSLCGAPRASGLQASSCPGEHHRRQATQISGILNR
jgi:hypothetical protein